MQTTKKLITTLTLTILLFTMAFTLIPIASAAALTEVWVDDSWTNQADVNVFDDSLVWDTDAFDTIQEGVDAVDATGTVYVLVGSYSERVDVDKSVTLEGAGSSLVTVTSPDLAVAAFTVRVDNVDISGFTAIADGLASIYLDAVSGCTISDNILAGNYDGIFLAAGSDGNTFTGNDASDQNQGFTIEFSDDNIFIDNIANGNTKYGFYVEGGENNTFTGNTAKLNLNGFKFVDGADNTLNYNNIVGNLGVGVKQLGTPIVDATLNWWGHASGPSGVGSGSGDAVSTNVVYDPWLLGLAPDNLPSSGHVGDEETVAGTSTTIGGLMKVYWDSVKDWDGTAGLLAEGYSVGEAYSIEITIPEAVAGPHYIIVKDVESNIMESVTFDVDSKIVLDPTAGIIGDTITVTGTGFASESIITLTGTNPLTTVPSTVTTSDLGSFTCEFDIVDIKGTITAKDDSDDPNSATDTLTVGTCIILTPNEGLPGIEVTILGRGFTADGTVDVRWGEYLTVVDDYPIDSTGTFTTTFTVPQVDTDDYTVRAEDSAKSAEADFIVKGVTKITLDPNTGLVGDEFTVEGVWFTPSSMVDITFDGTVLATDVVNANGEFEEELEVPDVAIGSYTVTVTDEEGIYATATYTVSPKITIIETRSDEYLQGDIISFYINSTIAFDSISIDIIDSSGYPLTTGDILLEEGIMLIPYADADAQLPSDALLGLWNWTATYTLTGYDETEVSGNFTVVELPSLSMVLDRLDEFEVSLTDVVTTSEGDLALLIETEIGTVLVSLDDLNASISLDEAMATISTQFGEVQTSFDAINLTVTAIEDDVATISTSLGVIEGNVTGISGSIATIETDLGTIEVDVSAVLADMISMEDAVSGLLMPVYVAIVLSLIAALAAAYSVIQIGRKIVG
ncbi:hypothetical protein ES707_17466 [subsurface metagenome]